MQKKKLFIWVLLAAIAAAIAGALYLRKKNRANNNKA